MTTASPPSPAPSNAYQILLVGLLSLNFGIVFFDRNALNFLMPFVKPEFGLSNEQVGLIQSGLSLTWALAAFGIGRLSDAIRNRKLLLVLSTLTFSVCSFLTGLAQGFALLLGARLLMGAAEGGVMPISHAMVAEGVSPERRGIAQGIAQNLGSNLLGSFVAPVLLVSFAAAYGWREAFYLAGVPGLISAGLIWLLIREPEMAQRPVREPAAGGAGLGLLANRNVLICALMSVLLVSYVVVCWVFMPLYLTETRGYAPKVMQWLMGTLGLSAALGSFLVSGLSDRIGRRPVMIATPLIGALLPLSAMFLFGPTWLLAAAFFIGWGLNGILPLVMATVPSESVKPLHIATALGLCMGAGELIGGVLTPWAAGRAADATNLAAPLWIMLGLAIAAAFCAAWLKETAPALRDRPGRLRPSARRDGQGEPSSSG
ncbi:MULTISPECIES: MFS transporter [Sphingomonas]|uniref:MFS transporter n=1 Tax=Sphingomonas lycopersici TaxID=2951807 RepID=A0AA42CQG9_9SPHN|nr:MULTISPECIES: MFS transporter [Sphingomonas]MCW6534902.1 MFS transporter [Sphingomonas lycopersici]OJU20423.1 MAG: MFS transporter [Sphingomonas sp. 66-10]